MMPKYCYGLDGQECLDVDIEDTVNNYLDMCDESDTPETLTVYEYGRRKASFDVDHFLETVYEWLDEEYGDPEGNATDIPDEVKEKAEELKVVILEHYESWICVKTGVKFEVDVKRYLSGDEHGAIVEVAE